MFVQPPWPPRLLLRRARSEIFVLFCLASVAIGISWLWPAGKHIRAFSGLVFDVPLEANKGSPKRRLQNPEVFQQLGRRAVVIGFGSILPLQVPKPTLASDAGLASSTSGGLCARDLALKSASSDPVIAPALLRLAFHDAGTRRNRGEGGPNGSVRFELSREENEGPSLRKALEIVRGLVEKCKVSWADAIAISGAAAVEATGGPVIDVSTGRKDTDVPDPVDKLPNPALTGSDIRTHFEQLGMTDEELVALCGAHTLGRWTSFLDVSPECLSSEGSKFWTCTREQGRRLPFTDHPATFNSEYFETLLEWERRQKLPKPTKRYKDRVEKSSPLNLLPSDVGLLFDKGLHAVVERFAQDKAAFFAAFSRAYLKLVAF
eukprot:TRINITY_DN82829_c0_g1_i1.p1 TRINITY_DN82829_c0_g1~~TRINITY_DN82829_c0_g1_i1.p1  ORF type:complete len:376 (-),score=59.57 TRINITY_DN82829_c0_g1_i1:132-1259(-)